MIEQHFWQVLFWLLTTLVAIMVMVISFFWKNFVKRIDDNFNELFTCFKSFVTRIEIDKIREDLQLTHDEVIKLKAKVDNCKNCNK